jgi:hypothetical protein
MMPPDLNGTNCINAEDESSKSFRHIGIHLDGREQLEKRFAALSKRPLKGTNRTDTLRDIRFYGPDIAFVDSIFQIIESATSMRLATSAGLMPSEAKRGEWNEQ